MTSGFALSRRKHLAIIFVIALAATGCSNTLDQPVHTPQPVPVVEEQPPAAPTLKNTNWQAVSILGKSANAAVSTLQFQDQQVAGNAGCNNFQGGFTIADDRIEFGALATTRKMCAPPINGQETVFLEALSLARTWQLDEKGLELRDERDTLLMQLQSR